MRMRNSMRVLASLKSAFNSSVWIIPHREHFKNARGSFRDATKRSHVYLLNSFTDFISFVVDYHCFCFIPENPDCAYTLRLLAGRTHDFLLIFVCNSAFILLVIIPISRDTVIFDFILVRHTLWWLSRCEGL